MYAKRYAFDLLAATTAECMFLIWFKDTFKFWFDTGLYVSFGLTQVFCLGVRWGFSVVPWTFPMGVCHIGFWVGAHIVTQPCFLRMPTDGKQSLWICLMTSYQLQFVLPWHRAIVQTEF